MKKVLLTLIIATVAIAADAQVWIGSSFGFRYFSEAEGAETIANFKFKPEIGTAITENLAVAVVWGFDVVSPDEGNTTCKVSINPYVRYNFMKLGNFKMFIDGGFTYYNNEEMDDWDISLKPGISYTINEHFNIVGHLGDGMVFREGDTKLENGFAFNLANNLTFTLNYVF
ncbi:MAG: hypothetical protein IKZ37_05290 [Bacteroidaceae bacterium]|nr:hypothetical protein [Bacteroidaceae bacterium]